MHTGNAITGRDSGADVRSVLRGELGNGRSLTAEERRAEVQSALRGAAEMALVAAANPAGKVSAAAQEPTVASLARRPAGTGLPGSTGIALKGRPTIADMENLAAQHGVEFAVVYKYGPGKNGGGGTYYMYSGDAGSVNVPVESDSMLIYHNHPGGTPYASQADMDLLNTLEAAGSPQRSSQLIPSGTGKAVRFTKTQNR